MDPIPTYYKLSPIMPTLLFSLLVISSVFPVQGGFTDLNDELKNSSVKTIQSPDGDVIYCVPFHLQPALIKKTPMDQPETPKGAIPNEIAAESSQCWSSIGESCPDGTIPIRRTVALDSSSPKRFERKIPIPPASSNITEGHEHAIVNASLNGTGQYYGAKAIINLWEPLVAGSQEFSLAQMWVTAGSYANNDLNTIEAGWQVFPRVYGDNKTRFFIYWTRDAYQSTGCYNFYGCRGFVQTNGRIVLGGTITPVSSYMGTQYTISIHVWKDPTSGNWWLGCGSDIVGYWPSDLFTNLNNSADTVEFGGEIWNNHSATSNTSSTNMGSGQMAEGGFGKAAFFRNLGVVDSNNSLIRVPNLQVREMYSNIYNIIPGTSSDTDWGSYFYFGGPGRVIRVKNFSIRKKINGLNKFLIYFSSLYLLSSSFSSIYLL